MSAVKNVSLTVEQGEILGDHAVARTHHWVAEAAKASGRGAEATTEELIEHASEVIARYKLPKAVGFRPTIERSPAGKADYRWAKAQAGT